MYKEPLLRELWEELDSVVYRLQTDGWDKGPLSPEEMRSWGIDIGQAQGIAYAIALTHDFLNPNIEWVRAEAMRRWEKHLEQPTPIGRRGNSTGQVPRDRRRDRGLRGRGGNRAVVDPRGTGGIGAARSGGRVLPHRSPRVAGR